MSGGHFDHNQYHLDDIADKIEDAIRSNGKNDWSNFSEETLDDFRTAISLLRVARVYVQRIDWLLSDDDGEDTFHTRLKEDLERLEAVRKERPW